MATATTPVSYPDDPAYPVELRARIAAFMAELSAEQRTRFDAILNGVDNAASAATLVAEKEVWQQVLAHAPGLAPALELVHTHVTGFMPPCQPPGADCQLPPLPLAD